MWSTVELQGSLDLPDTCHNSLCTRHVGLKVIFTGIREVQVWVAVNMLASVS